MSDEIRKKIVRTTRRHRELRLKLYALFLAACVILAAGFGLSNRPQAQETAGEAVFSKEEAPEGDTGDDADSAGQKDVGDDADTGETGEAETELQEDLEALSAQIAAEKEAYAGGFDSIREMEETLQTREEILGNPAAYPEQFIKDLERNPEIADFVKAYPTAEPKAAGGITQLEKPEDVPLFLQWDARWGYAPYGSNNIGISGCGPTCLSMVLYSLTGDRTLTPDFLAERATKEGYYVEGAGTAWSFLSAVCADYGVTAAQAVSPELAVIKEKLSAGGLIICSMGPGDFTDTGHFIVIRGITEDDELLVNDPFSKANSRKEWAYETIAPQMKQLWYYEKTAG